MKNIFTLVCFSLAIGASAQNLGDSIIAEYLFNKNTEDKSANGFDLTNVNGVFVEDRNGQDSSAIYLNGTNAYLARVNEPTFYAEEFSYSVWIKIDGMPPNGTAKIILSVGGAIKDNGISFSKNYLGQYNGLGVWTYLSGTQKAPSVLLPTYSDAGWHHVMSTCNNDSIKMYLDGVLIGSTYTGDIAGYTGSSNGFYIGCRTGNTQFFKGSVDDVRIWSRALEASEVVQVYNGTFTSLNSSKTRQLDWVIYPNPSTGSVTLQRFDNTETLTITVYNSIGQVVEQKQLDGTDLKLYMNSPGVYFIQASNETGINYATEKLVIH